MLRLQIDNVVTNEQSSGTNFHTFREAADTALRSTAAADRNITDLILEAANAMPTGSPEFDQGIAVGLALSQILHDPR